MPKLKARSKTTSRQRNRQHWGSEQLNDAGSVVRPDEQRQPRPGHARRSHAVNGYHKVEAGEDGGESGDEDCDSGLNHPGVAEGGAEGCVESPTSVHAAGDDAVDINHAGNHVEIPAQQIDSGKREVFGADHQRDEKIPQHGGDGRNQKEEDHHLTVHREELVIGIRLYEVAGRGQQFEANQQGKESSDEEEERNGREVQKRDALMIRGQQPRTDAVFFIQIVFAFGSNCYGRHCYSLGYCGFGARLTPACPPTGDGLNDLTYATKAFNCSSPTRP